ncbi:hypothetical protein VTO42DRAFT_1909 [Malbranchea cinnamomea]
MAQTESQQLPPAASQQLPPASQQGFSPPISSPSPSSPSPATGAPPPAKKPRLSPYPQTQHQQYAPQPPSFASPSFGTLQLPKPGTPVNGTSVNGTTSNISTNAPPPPPPHSMAPPPARTTERATDAAELTDVLASSGIDVKEEEAYLTQGYGPAAATTAAPQQPPRLQHAYTGTFASQGSAGTITPGSSFTAQTQPQQTTFHAYTPVSQAPPPPHPAPQPPPPPKTAEEIAADAAYRENTYMSRRAQYHLQDPFLHTSVIESRLNYVVEDKGLKLPQMGVFRPVPDQPPITVEVAGPDGSSVVSTGKTIMTHSATLGDIISLVSLACEERLRTLIEGSATLAQNRQINSRGIPDEWSDLAVVQKPSGEVTTTADGVNGDAAATASKKRSISEVNSEPSQSAADKKTTSLPNVTAIQSHTVIDKDVSLEDRRAAKRAKRNASTLAAAGESTPATPAGERAPEPERKITKKELKKAEARISDAVQHQQSIETARMATSGLASRFGGKKKQYSWLTSATSTPARPGLSTPNRPGSAPGVPAAGAAAGTTGPRMPGRRLGEWTEADRRAAGIQVRDILFMLEVDGLGKKPIQRGYSKQAKEELDRPR